jgi:hypothetical protein
MRLFLKYALLLLTSLIIVIVGFFIGFDERFLFLLPQVFIPLILISLYLAYDFCKSKKIKLFYFLIGINIALLLHQINAIIT